MVSVEQKMQQNRDTRIVDEIEDLYFKGKAESSKVTQDMVDISEAMFIRFDDEVVEAEEVALDNGDYKQVFQDAAADKYATIDAFEMNAYERVASISTLANQLEHQSMTYKLSQKISDLAKEAVSAARNAVSSLRDGIETFANKTREVVSNTYKQVAEKMEPVVEEVKDIGAKLGTDFKVSVNALDISNHLEAGRHAFLRGEDNKSKEAFNEATKCVEAFKEADEKFKNAHGFAKVPAFIERALALDAANAAVRNAQVISDITISRLDDRQAVIDMKNNVAQKIDDFHNAVVEIKDKAVTSIKDNIESFKETAVTKAKDAMSAVKETASNIKDSMVKNAESMLRAAGEKAVAMADHMAYNREEPDEPDIADV